MGSSGQLCSLRLEGTRRATFSQLPLTPSLEPPSPALWGLGGQGGDGAGTSPAAAAEDSTELQALTLPPSPEAPAQPRSAPPTASLSSLPSCGGLAIFLLSITHSHFLSLLERSRMR